MIDIPQSVTSVNGMTGDVVIIGGGGIADPGANGILTRTALNTTSARTITGTTNQVTVTNGNGVSGNPTLSLPQDIHTGASPTFAGVTTGHHLLSADSTYDFGSTSAYARNTYTDTLTLNSTASLSGGTAGVAVLQGQFIVDAPTEGHFVLGASTATTGRVGFTITKSYTKDWVVSYREDAADNELWFYHYDGTNYSNSLKITPAGALKVLASLGTSSDYVPTTYTQKLNLNSTASLDGSTAGIANLTGKLQVNSVQAIYVPDQTNFAGGMFLGNGGGSLSHASGDEGQFNTGVGVDALLSVTTGNYNTAIGRALRSNTTGANNASIGAFSLGANTTGGGNMAIGTYALGTNVDGYNNIAIGASALYNSKGYYNTAIGASAGFTKPSGDGCVFIGYRSGYYETGSNKLFIDNAQRASEADGRAKALVYGVFAATTAAQTLTVNGVLNTSENIQVDGTQVVSNRVVDARCDDAINSGDATTDGVIDALRDAMIAHGLIAAA